MKVLTIGAVLLVVLGLESSIHAQQSTLGSSGSAGTGSAINVINGNATNKLGAQNMGFSYNLGLLPNFQTKMNRLGHKPRILWYGDSTGGDTEAAFFNMFASNYLGGVDIVVAGSGPSGYFSLPTGVVQANPSTNVPPTFDTNFYSQEIVISNGAISAFGIPTTTKPVAALADTFSLYYIAGPGRGTCMVEVSTSAATNTWTRIMGFDTSTGQVGFRVAQTNLTLNNYNVRVTGGGGTENRIVIWWPDLSVENSTALKMYDMHENGATLADWLAQGLPSITNQLMNINPDIIVWQQTKKVSPMVTNWPAVATNFHTWASNADVILITSQPSNDPSGAGEASPDDGGQFQVPLVRSHAASNSWMYIDLTSLYNWTNNIMPAGYSLGGALGVHLNNTGQLFSGYIALKESGIEDILLQSSQLTPHVNPQYSLPTAFNPVQLAGAQYIYDVSLTNLASGNNLSFVADRSGASSWVANNRTMLNIGGGPMFLINSTNINSRGYAEFVGAQELQMSQPIVLTMPLTVFMVGRANTNAGRYFMDGTNSSNAQRLIINDGFIYNGNEYDYTIASNTWYLMEVGFGSNSCYLKTNGVLVTNGVTAGANILSGLQFGEGIGSGAAHQLFGDIAFFAMYNFQLSKAQTALVSDSINREFGVYSTNTYTCYGFGNRYTNTASTAPVIFNSGTAGSNIVEVTVPTAGAYLISANANYIYSGATYAAAATATLTLNKTNATAAVLANATRTVQLPIATTATNNIGPVQIPPVIFYAAGGETIQMQSILSATPAAGSVVIDSAEIVAQKLY